MAKNKYGTEYPAILKKKAKTAGVKVKKANYRFLDHFMLIQEEAEYPEVTLNLLEESEEIVLSFTTYQRAVVHMKMAAHEAGEIEFKSHVVHVPMSLAEHIGEQILAGDFIDNHLALQITIEHLNEAYAEIIMEGKLWLDCHENSAADMCSFYLLCFIEQINQVYHAIANTGYEIRLTSYGDNKVKVIKKLRELTGLGLKEVKNLVDAVPNAMIKVGNEQDAKCFCTELMKVGASAEIA